MVWDRIKILLAICNSMLPGAFTAHTLIPPLSLLTIRVERASDSTSYS